MLLRPFMGQNDDRFHMHEYNYLHIVPCSTGFNFPVVCKYCRQHWPSWKRVVRGIIYLKNGRRKLSDPFSLLATILQVSTCGRISPANSCAVCVMALGGRTCFSLERIVTCRGWGGVLLQEVFCHRYVVLRSFLKQFSAQNDSGISSLNRQLSFQQAMSYLIEFR